MFAFALSSALVPRSTMIGFLTPARRACSCRTGRTGRKHVEEPSIPLDRHNRVNLAGDRHKLALRFSNLHPHLRIAVHPGIGQAMCNQRLDLMHCESAHVDHTDQRKLNGAIDADPHSWFVISHLEDSYHQKVARAHALIARSRVQHGRVCRRGRAWCWQSRRAHSRSAELRLGDVCDERQRAEGKQTVPQCLS